jgi:hypothetical protein
MGHEIWAQEEFGHAKLGDVRRTRRAVLMFRRVAERPEGTVSGVFEKGEEREAAYRFLESDKIDTEELERSRGIACARRIEAHHGMCIVPFDQTSIHLHDHTGALGFGSVGTRRAGARGVHVLTALALTEQGLPLGILDQLYFLRNEEPSPRRRAGGGRTKSDRRPRAERESQHLIEHLDRVWNVAQQHAPDAALWFQSDRGGDYWGVLEWAADRHALMTVRLAYNRNVRDERGRVLPLYRWLDRRGRSSFTQTLEVTEKDGSSRQAQLEVTYGVVDFVLQVGRRRQRDVEMAVVQVRELRPPRGVKPIRWILGTTFPVISHADAERVIHNYTLRWRVEDFHRAWKSGVCNIEASQLRSPEAFRRWGILMSSMAVRAEHLKHLSREAPDAPASVAFSRDEIDLMIARRTQSTKAHTPYQPGDTPPLKDLVLWLAIMGGYGGSRSRPTFGTVVLTRGLDRLEGMVLGLRMARLLDAQRSG